MKALPTIILQSYPKVTDTWRHILEPLEKEGLVQVIVEGVRSSKYEPYAAQFGRRNHYHDNKDGTKGSYGLHAFLNGWDQPPMEISWESLEGTVEYVVSTYISDGRNSFLAPRIHAWYSQAKRYFIIDHGIFGNAYGLASSLPKGLNSRCRTIQSPFVECYGSARGHAVGLLPKAYLDFPTYQERIADPKVAAQYEVIETNPIAVHAGQAEITNGVMVGTAGIIGCNQDTTESILDIVTKLDNFDCIGVGARLHPWTVESGRIDIEKIEAAGVRVAKGSDPYRFTDYHEVLVGSTSSLLAEAIIRNNLHGRGQNFFQYKPDSGRKTMDQIYRKHPELLDYKEMLAYQESGTEIYDSMYEPGKDYIAYFGELFTQTLPATKWISEDITIPPKPGKPKKEKAPKKSPKEALSTLPPYPQETGKVIGFSTHHAKYRKNIDWMIKRLLDEGKMYCYNGRDLRTEYVGSRTGEWNKYLKHESVDPSMLAYSLYDSRYDVTNGMGDLAGKLPVYSLDHGIALNSYGATTTISKFPNHIGLSTDLILQLPHYTKRIAKFNKPRSRYSKEGGYFLRMESNPIAVTAAFGVPDTNPGWWAFSTKPTKVGILSINRDDPATIAVACKRIREQIGNCEITIKLHPMKERSGVIDPSGSGVDHIWEGDLYEFTDSMDILVSASSSTLVEAILREYVHGKGQKFFLYNSFTKGLSPEEINPSFTVASSVKEFHSRSQSLADIPGLYNIDEMEEKMHLPTTSFYRPYIDGGSLEYYENYFYNFFSELLEFHK